MWETNLALEDGSLFLRHTTLHEGRPTVVFVHGLGDSGLSFLEALEHPGLRDINLIIPDLLGYGRSSRAKDGDYTFEAQVRRLWALVRDLELERVCVVGHSVGGDLATLMADADADGLVAGIVNIEGDLTPYDIFISSLAVGASERGDFDTWFGTEFREKLVREVWGSKWPSCHRYYASLWFCRPDAFSATAREALARAQALPGRSESEIGAVFARLPMPKAYCWGSESVPTETRQFLEAQSIPNRGFEEAAHWLMIDRGEEFYEFLRQFVGGLDW